MGAPSHKLEPASPRRGLLVGVLAAEGAGIELASTLVDRGARALLVEADERHVHDSVERRRLPWADCLILLPRRTAGETQMRVLCEEAVAGARRGQTILLAAPPYAGATRRLLADALRARGLTPGTDVFVGCVLGMLGSGPLTVGGITAVCARRAERFLAPLGSEVVALSPAEAAELLPATAAAAA